MQIFPLGYKAAFPIRQSANIQICLTLSALGISHYSIWFKMTLGE